MIWMGILMGLPVLGLALFSVYPWQEALPLYLALTGISLFFDWLMMGAMHLPVRSGREQMIGSMTEVLNWGDHSGRVIWRDEIWQAEAEERRSFMRGDRVVIDSVSGLTLFVKPAGSMRDDPDPRCDNRLQSAGINALIARSRRFSSLRWIYRRLANARVGCYRWLQAFADSSR